jgi:hypothetical protein
MTVSPPDPLSNAALASVRGSGKRRLASPRF